MNDREKQRVETDLTCLHAAIHDEDFFFFFTTSVDDRSSIFLCGEFLSMGFNSMRKYMYMYLEFDLIDV